MLLHTYSLCNCILSSYCASESNLQMALHALLLARMKRPGMTMMTFQVDNHHHYIMINDRRYYVIDISKHRDQLFIL
jgi:hypothetical protein